MGEGGDTINDHRKKRPGVKNEKQTFELRRNAQRQSKCRKIKRLSSITGELHELTIEPVEVLIVIKEMYSEKYKYMGYGPMIENFEKGLPIKTGAAKKTEVFYLTKQISTREVSQLIPHKYGEALATAQKDKLQNIDLEASVDKVCNIIILPLVWKKR